MTQSPEERFADLVARQAPPARDALFRLEVLERRERARFRRRAWLWLALILALAPAAAAGLRLGPAELQTLAVLVFGVGVSALGVLYAPDLLRRLRALRA